MNDLGIRTRHPIVVTNWTNEEGTRFAPAMLASRRLRRRASTRTTPTRRTDPEGKRFGDELERIGWKGDEPVGARKMHAYFELHIEQGPILEAEGRDIGVVTHGQGLWWLEFTLTGKEAHTGSTPMAMRVNAGLGMARIIEMVHRSRWSASPTRWAAWARSGSTQLAQRDPGRVVFTVDIRSPDQAKLDAMRARSSARPPRSATALGVGFAIEPSATSTPSPSPRSWSRPCAPPPSGWATATATSSPAPATTPAGPRRWRRRPW